MINVTRINKILRKPLESNSTVGDFVNGFKSRNWVMWLWIKNTPKTALKHDTVKSANRQIISRLKSIMDGTNGQTNVLAVATTIKIGSINGFTDNGVPKPPHTPNCKFVRIGSMSTNGNQKNNGNGRFFRIRLYGL